MMKVNNLVLMNAVILGLAMAAVPQNAFAGSKGKYKLVYVCGETLNQDLADGNDFETAIGYFSGDNTKVYLAGGWPGIPRSAKITQNSETYFQIEGSSHLDSAIRLTVNKGMGTIEIGSQKYKYANAINEMDVMGAYSSKKLKCIYFPKNDVFPVK